MFRSRRTCLLSTFSSGHDDQARDSTQTWNAYGFLSFGVRLEVWLAWKMEVRLDCNLFTLTHTECSCRDTRIKIKKACRLYFLALSVDPEVFSKAATAWTVLVFTFSASILFFSFEFHNTFCTAIVAIIARRFSVSFLGSWNIVSWRKILILNHNYFFR